MNGEHLGDRLSGLLDGELSSEEEAMVHAHLGHCASCQQELEEVRTARAWVRALPPVGPPFGFYERLLRRSRPSRPRRLAPSRRARFGVAAVVGSAAAGFVLLGLGSPKDAPVAPPVARLVEAHATAGATGDPMTQLVPVGVPVSFGR